MSVSLQDIVKGLDPTGYTSISGSELAQLIDNGTPYTDKGMVIMTTDTAGVPDVPNAATTTKWKRYLWVRQTATTTKVYAWNNTAASDATYLKWLDLTNLSIAVGSVTNAMLAGGITNDKLVSIEYSKVSGVPTSLPPSGAAGGSLGGTYPNPTIAAGAVSAAMLASSVGYKLLQHKFTQDSSFRSGSTQIPFDNTPPLIGEGDEYTQLGMSITPILSTSKLVIVINIKAGGSTSANFTAALFRDGTIVAANGASVATTSLSSNVLIAVLDSTATALTTFRINVGIGTAGSWNANGTNGGGLYNANIHSTFEIFEVITT